MKKCFSFELEYIAVFQCQAFIVLCCLFVYLFIAKFSEDFLNFLSLRNDETQASELVHHWDHVADACRS